MPETSAVQDTPPEAPVAANRSALMIVFLVVFIDLLGFGIVLPLLPLYGDSYVAAVIPGGKENRLGGAVIGLLMASFSFMQFLCAPIWGRISDQVGRRPVLLIGLGGSVLFYSLFGLASSLPTTQAALALTLLFAARIGAGVAGATISTAQAVIADSTPPDKRKHGMALIGAAFGIGFTFGPLIGFLSLAWGQEYRGATGYAAAGLSLVALLLGLWKLPETRRFGEAPVARRKLLDLSAWGRALRTPAIAPVILTFFLATIGFASFEVTLALLNRDVLHLTERNNFLIFAYVGFVLMLTQGFLYRKIARSLTEPTLMALGIVGMGLGVGCLGGVSLAHARGMTGLGVFYLAALAFAVIGFALLTPSAQALISRRTDADRQGEVLGVNQSASALARILGGGLLLLMLPLIPRIRRGGTPAEQPA
jgi:MFS family permease